MPLIMSRYLLLFICCVAFACTHVQKEQAAAPVATLAQKAPLALPQASQITLIIGPRKGTHKDTLYFPDGGHAVNPNPAMRYASVGQPFATMLPVQKRQQPDTIVIKTNESIHLEHPYHYHHTAVYLLKPFDTLRLNYHQGVPHVTLLNRKLPDSILNFYTYFHKKHALPLSYKDFERLHGPNVAQQVLQTYTDSVELIPVYRVKAIDALYNEAYIETLIMLRQNEKYIGQWLYHDYDPAWQCFKDTSLLSLTTYKDFLVNYSGFVANESSTAKQRQAPFSVMVFNYWLRQTEAQFHPKVYYYVLYKWLESIAQSQSPKVLRQHLQAFNKAVPSKAYQARAAALP